MCLQGFVIEVDIDQTTHQIRIQMVLNPNWYTKIHQKYITVLTNYPPTHPLKQFSINFRQFTATFVCD